jgi:hypothetical protein
VTVTADIVEDFVVIARVHVALGDGGDEVWMVPMEITDDALSYSARVYPTGGAVILSVEPLQRQRQTEQEIVVSRTDTTLE